jgi:murein DD-endopeptidase MepM/ murein hydrolase activator NlpD
VPGGNWRVQVDLFPHWEKPHSRVLAHRLSTSLLSGLVVSCGGTTPAPQAPIPVSLDIASEVRPNELGLARLTNALGVQLVPQELIDRLVRWQNGMRDLLRSTAEALAEQFGITGPDLTVLVSDPIASMRTDESSGFGWRDDPIRHRRQFHSGADFRSQPGVEVLAAGDGVVVFTGYYFGYGNMIDVDHGGGVITRYAHLSKILAKKDTTITAGQAIGRVGMTGRTTGPHLHFEVARGRGRRPHRDVGRRGPAKLAGGGASCRVCAIA